MRKLLSASLVACMFALMPMLSVPAVADESDEPAPLRCTIDISVDTTAVDVHWEGTISGDIVGTIQLWEHPDNYVVGKVMHYFEDFIITTTDGDVIQGFEQGIWNFPTLKFRSVGCVADATGDWEHLEGYRTLQMGITSETTGPVITGTGTMMLMPT